MGSLRLPPIQLLQRVIGDDWTIETHRTAGTSSDWENPVVTMRRGPDRTAALVATSLDGTIILDGVNDPSANLVVPATNFTAGDLYIVIRRAVTLQAPPMQMWVELSVDSVALGGRQTVGFYTFPAVEQIAVESLP